MKTNMTRKQKAVTKAEKSKVTAYKASKRAVELDFTDYSDGLPLFREYSDDEFLTMGYYYGRKYETLTLMYEALLGETLTGDAKRIVQELEDDALGYTPYVLPSLKTLYLLNGADVIEGSGLSRYAVQALIENDYGLQAIAEWNPDIQGPYYTWGKFGLSLQQLKDLCEVAPHVRAERSYFSLTDDQARLLATVAEELLQTGLVDYLKGLRLKVEISKALEYSDNGAQLAKEVLQKIAQEDSSIDIEEIIDNIENKRSRKNYLNLGLRWVNSEVYTRSAGVTCTDKFVFCNDVSTHPVDIKVLNKFIQNETIFDGIESNNEIHLGVQLFGQQILSLPEARQLHSLFNLYGADTGPLTFKLTQQWQQFFAKNLSCIKYARLVDSVYAEKPMPKSAKQFVETVVSEMAGEGGGDLIWGGVDPVYMEEAVLASSEYTAKTKDNLPEVSIISGAYSFKKLEAGNKAALFIGLATDCCQHLGSAGKSCAIHSYENEDSATYVLTKDGLPVAQSWVWKDGNKLVIDSVEYKRGMSIERITDMWVELAKSFSTQGYEVFLGCTSYGCTQAVQEKMEELNLIEPFSDAPTASLKGYYGYMDGAVQYRINI